MRIIADVKIYNLILIYVSQDPTFEKHTHTYI